jgi:hypothetical protein
VLLAGLQLQERVFYLSLPGGMKQLVFSIESGCCGRCTLGCRLAAVGWCTRLTSHTPLAPLPLLLPFTLLLLLQVVVSNNPIVLRESTMHFGQYGLQVEALQDAGRLALQAMDWAHERVRGMMFIRMLYVCFSIA